MGPEAVVIPLTLALVIYYGLIKRGKPDPDLRRGPDTDKYGG